MDELRYLRRTPLSEEEDLRNPILGNEVAWLKKYQSGKFFQIPATHNLNVDPLYQSGRVVGMDAASVASVWALQVEPGMKVLDTCCAPGMKYMLLSEVGGVIGLDVNEQRLNVCRNLLRKFGYSDRQDSIFLMPIGWNVPSNHQPSWLEDCAGRPFTQVVAERRKRNKKKRAKIDPGCVVPELFDRVLVDAECTHDGSVRHVSKQEEDGFWSKHSKNEKNRNFFNNEEKMMNLTLNQRRLILNGFKLLKPGGIMVYSTCSLQRAQNQEIVEWLREEVKEEIEMGTLPFTKSEVPNVTFFNQHSCLFDPTVSGTSGQFISVIRKVGII